MVEYHVRERIAFITLNRPEKRNALSFELISALKQSFDQAESDHEVKVIILQARGEAFCAGADLAYVQKLQHFSYEENLKDSNHLKELYLKIYNHSKVIIAQVQGHALAGGCGLATVCDWVFAVPEARFGYTEVKIGFIPALVSVFLLRKVGEGRARELLLGGELISAERAQAFGLINRVVPPDSLDQEVRAFASKLIVTNAAASMALTKRLISDVAGKSMDEALRLAAEQNAHARGTEDCKRGIAAFLNKEKIIW
ncbi:MAG: enoyl-CoA hydratase/isomerase family protein [Cyclobacteriaceae bacterium]|nr:enoyl-CoA hydratase/isomerase family protein [Cyclobacteriaceae bacterium]UYN88068.1 MAG: enoyl-CoA hydratase/isomerase family protein [Cyclobacteriaceae bacterium]